MAGNGRYVALGSSMAAGPGIPPRVPGSPRPAMRSQRNYPHLVAAARGLDLTDVTYSGATTEHVLREKQNGTARQITALDGTESVVTITIGGNDAVYVPGMYAASLPRPLRWLPIVGGKLKGVVDPGERDRSLDRVAVALREVGRTVREHSPDARVLFVEYLTLLPPTGGKAWPMSPTDTDTFRDVADRLAEITAEAAAATGCEVVPVAERSRAHHAWSADPWTVPAILPWPGRPLAYHPNLAGMQAVADMVCAHLDG